LSAKVLELIYVVHILELVNLDQLEIAPLITLSSDHSIFYIIKEFVQAKMSQQQGIFYLEREREGVKEKGAGGRVSRHPYLRLGWVWER
jgi:hypothetical protein